MKKTTNQFRLAFATLILSIIIITFLGCKKEGQVKDPSGLNAKDISQASAKSQTPANPPFNLEAILRSDGKAFGHVKFRQDNDVDKIITLETWVRDLEPNHEYLLQRAVDVILDGNCTSSSWLTLGKGLVAQSILTDDKGTGKEDLWRDVSSAATGATFDIHFRVIDKATSAVVLTSDCYRYTVR
jgi:hypothetical protein